MTSREAVERFAEALDQLEGALREVPDGAPLAWALRELEVWLVDVTMEMRERRLRAPKLRRLLESLCAEVRVPCPDTPCLVLVGLSDEVAVHVARLLGDGYSIYQCRADGRPAYVVEVA